jgi:hypothetical protein
MQESPCTYQFTNLKKGFLNEKKFFFRLFFISPLDCRLRVRESCFNYSDQNKTLFSKLAIFLYESLQIDMN